MDKDTMAKHIERVAVLKQLGQKHIAQSVAALQLNLSVRQIRRLQEKYRTDGAKGLFHQNKGRESYQKISIDIEEKAMEWIRQNGSDFGPTFAQEKLEEYVQIKVSVGTVRSWLIKHGLWNSRRKRQKKLFKRRERKAHAGIMLQLDGSPHDWFEDRGDKCMLLTGIDDATGKIIARFAKQETTVDLMILLKSYIQMYGRPHSVYSDHGVPYKVNINNQDGEKKTQLGRALEELKIELIHANSPQAKGRVERNHGTNQDRLVKELRLRNICTIEAANEYLEKEYIPQFNQRFTVKPTKVQDAHRPSKGYDLDKIFSIQEERIMQNDGIVQYEGKIFQITKNRIYVKPKGKILVCTRLDGSLSFWIDTIQLGYEQIYQRSIKIKETVSKKQPKIVKPSSASNDWNNGVYRPIRLTQLSQQTK